MTILVHGHSINLKHHWFTAPAAHAPSGWNVARQADSMTSSALETFF